MRILMRWVVGRRGAGGCWPLPCRGGRRSRGVESWLPEEESLQALPSRRYEELRRRWSSNPIRLSYFCCVRKRMDRRSQAGGGLGSKRMTFAGNFTLTYWTLWFPAPRVREKQPRGRFCVPGKITRWVKSRPWEAVGESDCLEALGRLFSTEAGLYLKSWWVTRPRGTRQPSVNLFGELG